MAKQTDFNVIELLNKIKSEVKAQSNEQYIPNIIEFCESEHYLNLTGNGIELYPMQRIILKSFYRGQPGNENLKLDEEEIQLLYETKLDHVIEKYRSESLFRELVLVLGRRCVSEDATIIDPCSGREWALGEMWDYGKTNGIMSWTLDERTHDMKMIPNCQLVNQGMRPVYRLQTKSGHEIEATENHPFLTQRGWVHLKDIDVNNDKVAIVESIPFFGNSDAISEDEAAILGYMTGDGNCSQSATFFTCSNSEVLHDFKTRINRISGNLTVFNDPWTTAKSKQYQYKITCKDRLQEKYYNDKTQKVMSKMSKTDLQKLLIKHGLMGKTCHYKIIPKNVIAAYLRALYSCDGSVHSSKGQVCVSFCTVNGNQAQAVRNLLAKFGIVAHLRRRKQKTFIRRENKSYNNVSYEVYFKRSLYVQKYFDSIGFIGKGLLVQEYIQSLGSAKKSESIRLQNIRSIQPCGSKRTFDIQVSDKSYEQNFTANNFLVHNSGKDFMVSLMALYEAMRLLEMPGGSPTKYYKIAEGNPIYILTIATSADQAKILFTEIKEKMFSSDYFHDKIGSSEADRISLLTPNDKKRQVKMTSVGLDNAASKIKGSIVIMSGHSNSEGLLGKRIYALLLDEVAAFKTTGGATSGDRIYSALAPATADFKRIIGKKEDGSPKAVTDSKIISISSPRSEEGMLFKLYNDAGSVPARLAFKLPTWKVNIPLSEDDLRAEFKFMSVNDFNMEFGAEFSGTAGEKFIPDHYIDEAMDLGAEIGLDQREGGIPGMIYFAHLDPAATSHNYALVVMHVEQRIRVKEQNGQLVKERVKIFVVDHMKAWQPEGGQAINVFEVDKYITLLARRFRFAMVSYDNWNSQASVQNLRRKGVPTKITPFRKQYKMTIYDHLEHLLVDHQLALPRKGPHASLMEQELKCLKRIYTPVGFKIQPNPEAQVTTDDLTDALAGVCALAIDNIYSGYARSGTVRMPQIPSSGSNDQWNIGHGTYSGKQWDFMHRKFGF